MRRCAVLPRSSLSWLCPHQTARRVSFAGHQHLCSRQKLSCVHWQSQHSRTFVTLWCRKSLQGEGMVLPFDPMTLTFKDLHYFVEIPKVGQSNTADCIIHQLWPHIESAAANSYRVPSRKLRCILAAALQSGKFA